MPDEVDEHLKHLGLNSNDFARALQLIAGGVSNVDIDGNNALNIKAIVVIISTFETLPATLYRLMYAIAPEPVYTLGSESNLWSKSAFHDMVKRMALLEHFGMADDIANMAIYLVSPAGGHVT
jgi:hypothetical protein